MREMKDSGVPWIGKIPASLKLIRNKYLLSYEKGRKADNTNVEQEGVPYIGASDLDSSGIAKLYTTDTALPDVTYDDVLVLWDGARAGLVGTNKVGKLSSTVVKLIPDENVVSKHFFYWYYMAFQQFMYDMVNGTTIPHMSRRFLEEIGFLSWSLDEQNLLAEYLDTKCAQIDTIIAREQSVIEKLQEYKQAIITQAITKGLNSSAKMKETGFEWIGMVPEHWDVKKIKYLTSKIGSGKTPKGGSDVYIDEGVLFIRSQNVYDGYFDLSSVAFISHEIDSAMSNTRVYRNDVLLNITGGSIGRSCLYESDELANVNQHVCIIRCNNQMRPKFMQYFWNSRIGKISIDIYQSGANREGLNFTEIGNTLVPTPKLHEQDQIIDYLDGKCGVINDVIQQKHSLINKLTEYKKSLIYEVVTGKKEISHV